MPVCQGPSVAISLTPSASKYKITSLEEAKEKMFKMSDWVCCSENKQKVPNKHKGKITVNQSYQANIQRLRSKLREDQTSL